MRLWQGKIMYQVLLPYVIEWQKCSKWDVKLFKKIYPHTFSSTLSKIRELKYPSPEPSLKRHDEHHFQRQHSCHLQKVYTSEMMCGLLKTRNKIRNQSTAVLTVKLDCARMVALKVTIQISTSNLIPGVAHVHKHTTSYSRASLNDRDTFWEMHCKVISSLCEHHTVYLHKRR